MKLRKRSGQSTVETLLLLSVISMGLLFAFQQLWHKDKPVRQAADSLIQSEQQVYANTNAVK